MNDNFKPFVIWQAERRRTMKAQKKQLAELQDFAMRAVLSPETLTLGEIQEVGWGYILASRALSVKGTCDDRPEPKCAQSWLRTPH